MLSAETKQWAWDAYKTYYAILLIGQHSAFCVVVHKDEDIANIECEKIQKVFPKNRYVIVPIPTADAEGEQWLTYQT